MARTTETCPPPPPPNHHHTRPLPHSSQPTLTLHTPTHTSHVPVGDGGGGSSGAEDARYHEDGPYHQHSDLPYHQHRSAADALGLVLSRRAALVSFFFARMLFPRAANAFCLSPRMPFLGRCGCFFSRMFFLRARFCHVSLCTTPCLDAV